MTAERERPARTLGVAALIAIGCALLVSTSVAYLRPLQTASERLERQRDIVTAAGLAAADELLTDERVLQQFERLQPRLVDLDEASFVGGADPLSFDVAAAAADPDTSVVIAAAADTARLDRRPRHMPVFLTRDRGEPLVVLSVYGTGMWSTIEGYIAVAPADNRVLSLTIHKHGETPGVGDRIEADPWLDSWSGRALWSGSDYVRFRLGGSGDIGPADEPIEAISGATVTAGAVVAFVNYWLGADGYGPFLRRLAADSEGAAEQ
ncbi:MAG: FMN-binding protein [Pseudomonadota bacterium]